MCASTRLANWGKNKETQIGEGYKKRFIQMNKKYTVDKGICFKMTWVISVWLVGLDRQLSATFPNVNHCLKNSTAVSSSIYPIATITPEFHHPDLLVPKKIFKKLISRTGMSYFRTLFGPTSLMEIKAGSNLYVKTDFLKVVMHHQRKWLTFIWTFILKLLLLKLFFNFVSTSVFFIFFDKGIL